MSMSDEAAHDEVSSGYMLVVDDREETCPQVVPKCVYISKENVLQQALESLSLNMQEIRSCTVGNDQVIASVCIDAPAHGKYSMLHQRRIFGDYKLTTEAALESARLATILHLQKIGVIYVDDVNFCEITRCEAKLADCQRKLLAASNWANMFQEETECLKGKLDSACKENEKLIAAAKVLSVKKEELVPQETNIKQEASAAQTSTPPPSDHDTATRFLQRKKRTISHETGVKRTLFKPVLIDGCKSQTIKSEEENT